MSLIELVDNSRTDKNTVHSYLETYETLLNFRKYSAKYILEIGILHGGSINLWKDYFLNATIYGLDILNINNISDDLKNHERIKLFTSIDAYNENFINNTFLNNNIKFDMILDDGPHTFESMCFFIKYYSQLLSDNGILILEDIQSYDWIEPLKNIVPEELKKFVRIYDLRSNKNRYDDLILVINKI